MHYTCPRCGSETSHPQDCMHGYCARCHDWTGEPCVPGPAGPRPWSYPDADPLADLRESMQEYYGRPAPLAAGEMELTPGVLLTDTRWSLAEETDESFLFTFDPLAGPWVSSWRPDLSLGAFTVSWERSSAMLLQVGREAVEQAAGVLAAELPFRRLRRCPVLCHVLAQMHARIRAAVQHNYHPVAIQHADRFYRCASCGTEFTVPQEHSELGLCAFHSPPERMEPVPRPGLGPWEPGSNGEAAQHEAALTAFYRAATAAPASLDEALAAVRELHAAERAREDRGLIAGAVAQWEAAQDRARENIVETITSLAGRRAEIRAGLPAGDMDALMEQFRAACGLPPAQGVLDANPDLVLDTQVAERARELEMPPRPRAGSHTGDSSAARRARRASRHEDPGVRRARVVAGAEAMIARLDGEGYGIRAKAAQVDADTPSVPELPLFDPEQGGNASRWSPGDPIM